MLCRNSVEGCEMSEKIRKDYEQCGNCGHHKGAHIFSSDNACLRCHWFGVICKEWKPTGIFMTERELDG